MSILTFQKTVYFYFFGLYFIYFFCSLYYFLAFIFFVSVFIFLIRLCGRLFFVSFFFFRFVSLNRPINFPLRTAFTAPYRFWKVMLSFSFISNIFWFPLWFFHWHIWFFSSIFLYSTCFSFSHFLLLIDLCFIQILSEKMLDIISILSICWNFFCDLSWSILDNVSCAL